MQKLLLLSLFSILFTANLSAKTTRYVTTNGTGDGSSWANASNSIQAMIDNSVTGDDVWVAAGTYYPTTETIARDARSRTFLLKSGVNLYGGFAGVETTIYQRSLSDLNSDGIVDNYEFINQTVLSGDVDDVKDVWAKSNTAGTWRWPISGNENNSYRVVTCFDLTIVNGFFITGGNANHTSINTGGGIYSPSLVVNCIVSNCYASKGGGVFLSSSNSRASYCMLINCSAANDGGGMFYYSANRSIYNAIILNCKIFNCSATNGGGIYLKVNTDDFDDPIYGCVVSNCSALVGGGIYCENLTNAENSVHGCVVSNCIAGDYGGGIYVKNSMNISNCSLSNCSTNGKGGGICSNSYSSIIVNCAVFNCYASEYSGGIYVFDTSTVVKNCASSNNSSAGVIGSGIVGSQLNCISPMITNTYIQPTNFIGISTTEEQNVELINANCRLKDGSPCINAGAKYNYYSGRYGALDIGAYEFELPIINVPINEKFENYTDWVNSEIFYHSDQIIGNKTIKWIISDQKAVFNWETNLSSVYNESFFTYQIDASNTSKLFFRYDMFFQAYAGTITPLGTEKLNVEYSTDLINWTNIAAYTNANGTIANQTYRHDLSNILAGKKFFIRFNANGENSNRIEKWEIDNVNLYTDGLSGVNTLNSDKYIYIVTDGTLKLSGLQCKEHITLYDITGKIISTKTANSDNLSIKLPCVGVYMVSINSNGVISNKRIIY